MPGFTVFYIGINVGGFLGPLVTGWAQVHFGLRAGFAAAALFMGVGVLQFYLTQRHLGDCRRLHPSRPRPARQSNGAYLRWRGGVGTRRGSCWRR